MAEIRKFQPGDGDGIQKLVRDALGENIRPVNTWDKKAPAEAPTEQDEAAHDDIASIGLSDHYGFTFGVVDAGNEPDQDA